MTEITDDPSYWLGRAKEMRELLKSICDEEMAEIIEDIARGFERIAERLTRH